jgi:hypothetical protein
MKRALPTIVSVALPFVAVGCGCGDRFAYRRLDLTATGLASPPPFEIDTSRLPPGAVRSTQKQDHCGQWTTVMSVHAQRPFKVVLVPTTQP